MIQIFNKSTWLFTLSRCLGLVWTVYVTLSHDEGAPSDNETGASPHAAKETMFGLSSAVCPLVLEVERALAGVFRRRDEGENDMGLGEEYELVDTTITSSVEKIRAIHPFSNLGLNYLTENQFTDVSGAVTDARLEPLMNRYHDIAASVTSLCIESSLLGSLGQVEVLRGHVTVSGDGHADEGGLESYRKLLVDMCR